MSKKEEQLKEVLEDVREKLVCQQNLISTLLASSFGYAVVIRPSSPIDINIFLPGDLVSVLDNDSPYYNAIGKILNVNFDTGIVEVEMGDDESIYFSTGHNNSHKQVKLLTKDDGTDIVIIYDGSPYEVKKPINIIDLKVGDTVKVNTNTKQIIQKTIYEGYLDVVYVKSIVEDKLEVETSDSVKLVYHILENVKVGDRVGLDRSNNVAMKILPSENKDIYVLNNNSVISWEDIAGLEEAKQQLIETIEYPLKHKDTFKFYGKSASKGVLLYGAPGCGKTLLGKAVANSLSKSFGEEGLKTGFIYVKGPEILSKFVGEAERNVRSLFFRGKEHYTKYNFPAVLFIDEADALLPMRGTGISTDVHNGIVAMFLAEMDGLELSNMIVILATNRQNYLDPAITREGRIDKFIKVDRPNNKTASSYFKLHLKNAPLANIKLEEAASYVSAEVFSSNYIFYHLSEMKSNTVYKFSLGNILNGAMIAGIVEQAKNFAIRRDLKLNQLKGIEKNDLRESVISTYHQHISLNHSFDLEDFCEVRGLNKRNLKIEKLSNSSK